MHAVALCVVGTAAAALFRPASDCEATPAGQILVDWNHLFPGARHDVGVSCSSTSTAPNGSLAPAVDGSGGIEISCVDSDECGALVAGYVVPVEAQDAPLIVQIAAASSAVGVPQVACTTTVDCTHPAAVCGPTDALTNVGYCRPGPVAAPTKAVCHDGLHASCDELIVAAVGLLVGVAVWAAARAARGNAGTTSVQKKTVADVYADVLKVE